MNYNNNLEIIKKCYKPYLRIIEDTDNINTDIEIEKCISTNNKNNLFVHKNGTNTKLFLHSVYDQYQEAKNMINHLNIKNNDNILIIYGAGLFFHIEYIASKYPDKIIIVIEPYSEIFISAMHLRKLNVLNNKNITLLLTDDIYNIAYNLFYFFKNHGFKEFDVVPLMSYYVLDKNKYISLFTELKRTFKFAIVNIHTELNFIKHWTKNQLQNYQNIIEQKHICFNTILDNIIDMPALIVGAGPSLNKHLQLLKENQTKFLIIAAGSSISILKKNGIIPHLSVVLDGGEKEDLIIEDVNKKSLLIYHINASYKGIKNSKAIKSFIIPNDAVFFAFEEYEYETPLKRIQMGPSCINVATDIAVKLGCKNITFIGQDMAYTDKQLYAKDAILFDTINTDTRKRIIEKDIYGKDTETNNSFLTIKDFFEVYTSHIKDVSFINCTEGGLGIEGVPNQKFSDIVRQFKDSEVDNYKLLKDKIVNMGSSDLLVHENQRIKKYKKEINEIVELSRKRKEKVSNLLNEYDTKSINYIRGCVDEIVSISDKIEEFLLNKNIISKRLSSYDMTVRNKVNTSVEQIDNVKEKYRYILTNMSTYYTMYHNLAEYIKEILNDGREQ